MSVYRKKPVEIEAVLITEIVAGDRVPAWVTDAIEKQIVHVYEECIVVNTLEGRMRGDLDDYLIKGVQGELYPCKNSVFVATYDWVGE